MGGHLAEVGVVGDLLQQPQRVQRQLALARAHLHRLVRGAPEHQVRVPAEPRRRGPAQGGRHLRRLQLVQERRVLVLCRWRGPLVRELTPPGSQKVSE